MTWEVRFDPAFELEFNALLPIVQYGILARVMVVERFGPSLGRPRVDTLSGSKHANMKELRFNADNGVWRLAFAFDPNREAILLAAGDKSGVSERLFYRELLRKADDRFDTHLARLQEERRGSV